MMVLRRRLRLWVGAWLVVQAASLSAFVPRDCCAAHRTDAAPPASDHHATGAHCPMPAADGTPCPMHSGSPGHAGHEQRPTPECSMRGACDGPMSGLAVLLSPHAILPDFVAALPPDAGASVAPVGFERLLGCLASLDPPPPRS